MLGYRWSWKWMFCCFVLVTLPSFLQAGHWTAAGLSHPGYRHKQTKWVPNDLQRTSGQPGPGSSAGFTQTLYTAGIVHRLHFSKQFFLWLQLHYVSWIWMKTLSTFTIYVHFFQFANLQIALKCADICNPCRVWELSRQWSERVCEEFYRQGERMFYLNLCQGFLKLSVTLWAISYFY